MKKPLSFIAIMVLALVISTACGSSSAPDPEAEAEEIKTAFLYLDVSFEQNLFLNKYDVFVELNGERLSEIKHGDYFTYLAEVPCGDCTVKFINTEKSSVTISKDLDIESDTTYKCMIHTDSDVIVIKEEEVMDGIEGNSLSMPDVVGNNLKTAREELETIGFVNINNKANDDSVILMESNWVVVEQSVSSGTELDKNQEITLTCRKETELFSEAYKDLNLADAMEKASEEGFTSFVLKEDCAYTNVTKRLAKITDEEAAKWLITDAGKISDTEARFYITYTGEVTVPDVVGMTVKDAKKALRKQYAFNIETEDVDGFWILDDETWKVEKQSVKTGTIIKYSDQITLTCKEVEQKEQTSKKQSEEKQEQSEEKQKQSEERQKQPKEKKEGKKESKNKSELEAFVGKHCFDATEEIRALGYEPYYIAANTSQDMTGQIHFEQETSYNDNEWIIVNMIEIDDEAKTVTYIVTSQWMRDTLYGY